MRRPAVISAVLAAFAAAPPPAAAGTGRVELRAVVEPTCRVEISHQEIAIDLRGNATLVPVARVREECNAVGGYTVTISSQNGGVMQLAEGEGVEQIGYVVTYDGQSADARDIIQIERGPGTESRSGEVLVSVPRGGPGNGVYRDVLVVTVTAR